MMTRRALLIAGGDDPKIGAEEDIRRYKLFLNSKIGGAWEDDDVEIKSLVNPTNHDLIDPLLEAADADYSLIVYSGHGNHPARSLNPLYTRVALSDGDMPVRDFDKGRGKQTIIVDACRAFARLPAPAVEFITEHTRIAARRPSWDAYRDAFERAVMGCQNQITYLFACDIDQYSYGNATHGGLYSRTLYSSALAWERDAAPDTFLTIAQAHLATYRRVSRIETPSPQRPVITRRGLTSGRYFPFCIKL